MKAIRKHISTIILILVFLAGISLVLYPTVSDYWNSLHQSRAIAGYDSAVSKLDTSRYDEMLAEARAYNEAIRTNPSRFTPTEEETAWYRSLLDVSGTGIMAYVEIPKLREKLPVYHGTDDAVLQIAVGHIEGSSLPVGGEGTHSVLSGHRGLPSAKLFTNLDELETGNIFLIHVLGEELTYEVDQILTVLPYETEALEIEEGKDYCTLVTCTPYGVNTHRLLVRGHRIETKEESVPVAGDAGMVSAASESWEEKALGFLRKVTKLVPVPVIAAGAALLLLIFLLASSGRRGGKRKDRRPEVQDNEENADEK